MLSVKKLLFVAFITISAGVGVYISVTNPVEEMRKQQDEVLQTNATEFIQATILYYSAHGGLPWFSTSDNGVDCFGYKGGVPSVAMPALEECIKIMIAETQLPSDFFTRPQIKALFVTNPSPHTDEILDTVICFKPQSKTWQQDLHTRYNQNGTAVADNSCISHGGRQACYWCTQ